MLMNSLFDKVLNVVRHKGALIQYSVAIQQLAYTRTHVQLLHVISTSVLYLLTVGTGM